ncbi:MAG: hypothetical protein NTX53_00440 [candidate division WOR-3 bacterium]|nr:hypothetical protein [candidate division WOR-3 bacterium]
MKKTVVGLFAAVLLAGAGRAAGAEPASEVPPLDPGIIMVEGSGAVLGGAACAAGLGFLLARLYDPSADVWKTFGGTVLGGSLGYPVFCGVGCWGSGMLVRQQGRLDGAIVGALAATPVGLTIAWIGTLVERLPPGSIKSSPFYVAAALVPPAGAVLGYNLSRPKATDARSSRLGVPELLLGTAANEDGSLCPALNLRLVNVRF